MKQIPLVFGGSCLMAVLMLVISTVVGGAIIYLVWNHLVIDFTGWRQITFVQGMLASLALTIISGLVSH